MRTTNIMESPSIQALTDRIAALERELAALRAVPGLHDAITHHASVGIFITDTTGHCTYVNEAWCRMTGIDASTAIGGDWSAPFHPEDRETMGALWRQAVESRQPLNAACRLVTPEGRVVRVHGTAAPLLENDRVTGYVGSVIDITRQYEETSAREAQWNLIARNMSENVWIMDMDLHTTFINSSVISSRGFTLEEVRELPLNRHLAPASYQKAMETVGALLTPERLADQKDAISVQLELEFYRKDGTTLWSEVTCSLIRDDTGKPQGILGVGRNITDRKNAETALRELEYRNTMLINALPDIGILLFDRDHRFLAAGGRELTASGFDESLVVGKTLREAYPPAVADHFGPYYDRALAGEEHGFDYEYEGTVYHEQVLPMRDDSGAVTGGMVVAHNITAVHRAQREWRESDRRYREMLDTTRIAAVMLDRSGCVTYCNDFLLTLTGWSHEEVIGGDWFDRFIPDPSVKNIFLSSVSEGTFPPHFENDIVTRSGERRSILWNNTVLRDAAGLAVGTSSMGLDLTERKAADEALKKSEKRLASILQAAPVAICVMRDRNFVMINDTMTELTGYSSEELTGQSSRLLYTTDEEWRDVGDAIISQIADLGYASLETTFHRRDGLPRTVYLRTQPMNPGDTSREMAMTAMDITQRKHYERALIESSNRQLSILESMHDAYITVDVTGRVTFTNRAAENILNREHTHLIGRLLTEALPFLAGTALERELRRSQGERAETAVEEYLPLPDGGQWLDIRCYPIRDGVSLYLRVITEQKRLEEYRHLNEERTKALYELTQLDFTSEEKLIEGALGLAISFTGSRYGYYHFIDNDQENITLGAWSRGVHVNCTTDLERHYPLSEAGIWADCARTKAPVIHNNYPNEPNRKGIPEGHVPITRHMSIPIMDGGAVRCIAGVANKEQPYEEEDVHQFHLFMDGVWKIIIRRRAEDWLARELGLHMALAAISEALIAGSLSIPGIARVVLDQARMLTRSAHGFVGEVNDETGAIVMHQLTELPGMGNEPQGPLTLPRLDDGTYPGVWGEALNRRTAFFTNDVMSYQGNRTNPHDEAPLTQFMTAPAMIGGNILGLIALANSEREYTDNDLEAIQRLADLYAMAIHRIRVEQSIKGSLVEKEVLIKEIHHRVKNNLQVIASLLALQAPRVSNPADLELFEESQNRVYTMALVHEKLYQSPNLARIDFDGYIRSLVQHLVQSYSVQSAIVETVIMVRDVALDIDRAIPCAQIVNELVSNALKHAFPGNQSGVITIECERLPSGACRLSVADDGAGLPADLDPASTGSLGLQIVMALTRQLGATMTIDRKGGTRFTVEF